MEFHVRINKTISAGVFRTKQALKDAQQDWVDDIARFAEDATLSSWLATARDLFRQKARTSLSKHGWDLLFQKFDKAGVGELDFDQFLMCACSQDRIQTHTSHTNAIHRIHRIQTLHKLLSTAALIYISL
eukprot:SAG31_NODE_6133_length_2156_cov_1.166262_3_plen_130_part_00